MKPSPEPVVENVRGLALSTMQQAKFPMLASMDGDQPRVRPVSPVKTVEFTAFVASFVGHSNRIEGIPVHVG